MDSSSNNSKRHIIDNLESRQRDLKKLELELIDQKREFKRQRSRSAAIRSNLKCDSESMLQSMEDKLTHIQKVIAKSVCIFVKANRAN